MAVYTFTLFGITFHIGDSDDDTVTGTNGTDIIISGGGDDVINAGAGNDIIYAGSGDDIIHGDAGDDFISAGSGNDTVFGDGDDDLLLGGSGNDTIQGNAGNDIIYAGSGDDKVEYNLDENIGYWDFAHGGHGTDELEITVSQQFLNDNALTAADISQFFSDNGGLTGGLVNFSSLGFNLTVKKFEEINVVVVGGGNNAPIAVMDSFADVIEDVAYVSSGSVLDNDSDPDMDPISVITTGTIATAQGGTVTMAADGTFTYDQNGVFDSLGAGITDNDSFSYTISDGQGGTASAIVNLTITGVNDLIGPVTDDNAVANTIAEDATAGDTVGITALALDPDAGDIVSYSVDDARFDIDSNGVVTYNGSAPLDFETEASIDVLVTATSSDTSTSNAIFTIAVTNVNEAIGPVTDDNAAVNTIAEDATAGDTVGITALAVDPDAGDIVSYSIDDARFDIDSNGVVTYNGSAPLDFETEASIDVLVTATSSDTSTSNATFTIAVTDVNQAPTDIDLILAPAGGLEGNRLENVPGALFGTVTFTDPDGDVLTNYTVSDPRFILVPTLNPNEAELRLQPGVSLDFETDPTIDVTITVTDPDGLSYFELFTLDVVDVNEAPIAGDVDLGTLPEDAVGMYGPQFLVNSNDPDVGDSVQLIDVVLVDPSQGTIEQPAGDLWWFTPTLNFNGLVEFTFTIQDTISGNPLNIDTATATLNVTPVNDAPTAVNDVASTDENAVLNAPSVLANDTDPDIPDTKTVVSGVAGALALVIGMETTLASGALLTLNADGTYIYDPNGAFDSLNTGEFDTEIFSYTMEDSGGLQSTATVTITINGVTPPALFDETANTVDFDTLAVGDNDPTTYYDALGGDDNVTLAQSTSAILNANGGDYDPNNTFSGGAGNDTITGQDLNDIIDGGIGNDVITGGAGDDILDGGAGDDALDGGAGFDTLDLSAYGILPGSPDFTNAFPTLNGAYINANNSGNVNDGIIIPGAHITATVGNDTFTGIEKFVGTDSSDFFEFTFSTIDLVFVGNGGKDVYVGGVGSNDTVDYSSELGTIPGLPSDGINVIFGNVIGGALSQIQNSLDLSAAIGLTDTWGNVEGFSQIENIIGTARNDSIQAIGTLADGAHIANILTGLAGDDRLSGGAGNDTLDGGADIDTVDYLREEGTGGVTVDLIAGTATDTYGDTDTLISIENVTGTNSNDTITSDANDNNIQAQGGDDVVIYNYNNGDSDFYDGGTGNDTLFLQFSIADAQALGYPTYIEWVVAIDTLVASIPVGGLIDFNSISLTAAVFDLQVQGFEQIITDFDGDGVADFEDAFIDDPTAAASITETRDFDFDAINDPGVNERFTVENRFDSSGNRTFQQDIAINDPLGVAQITFQSTRDLTYNANGDILTEVVQDDFDGDAIIDFLTVNTLTYDANNNRLTNELTVDNNPADADLDFMSLTTSTYDANDRLLTSSTIRDNDPAAMNGNEFEQDLVNTYTLDGGTGELTVTSVTTTDNNGDGTDDLIVDRTNVFDVNDNLLSSFILNDIGADTIIDDQTTITNTYHGNGVLASTGSSALIDADADGTFDFNIFSSATFNTNGDLLTAVSLTPADINATTIVNTYDASFNLLTSEFTSGGVLMGIDSFKKIITTNTYNLDNNLETSVTETFLTGDFILDPNQTSTITNVYDPVSGVLDMSTSLRNPTVEDPDGEEKVIMNTYDGNDNLLTSFISIDEFSIPNTPDGIEETLLITNTYFTGTNTLQTRRDQSDDDGDGFIDSDELMTFDLNGNVVSEVRLTSSNDDGVFDEIETIGVSTAGPTNLIDFDII